MHGVMLVTGGKKMSQKLNNRYAKRPAKVRGDNGLTVGDWFPTMMVALFRGAHGQSQGGITGTTDYGAYSIVVAGTYKDVDDDQGDTIYYSGPGSQTNKDPNNLANRDAVGYLQRSVTTRNPVRVLRSAKSSSSSAHAPSVGLRYDGLYHVVRQEQPFKQNGQGGLYTRYVLQRLPGQESLASIQARSPSPQQVADYHRIWDLWPIRED
ncbi:hypothetical protein SLS53_003279 [Cytospora paraplurivora]|uniref:YDG domain-containing protein n=1 Tax=Cytospora paraplurivora TaxID=2898453 RepID=A0AAN9UB90_9PEZI